MCGGARGGSGTYVHNIDLDVELSNARDDIVSLEQLIRDLYHAGLILGGASVAFLPRRDPVVASIDLALRCVRRVDVDAEACLVHECEVLFDVREVRG